MNATFYTNAALIAIIGFAFWPLITHPTEVVSSGRTDIIHGHLPYRIVMAESLRSLRGLPSYNPTAFGGTPLTADPQSGLTYPPNWLHALSADGGAVWFGWLMFLHCLLAGVATLWWLKESGFSPGPRLAGAVALALAGKWFHHVVVSGHVGLLPLAWLPLQLGLVDRICAKPRTRDVAWLAGATALLINGSHPQLLLYAQCVVVLYAVAVLLSARRSTRLRSLFGLVAAACLALGLSARYLLPVLDGMSVFIRGEGLPYAVAALKSIETQRLIEAILPAGGGYLRSSEVIFIGSASLAIAIQAPLLAGRRAVSIGFIALLGLLLVYALGAAGGVHPLVHEWLPGFSLFRIPARALWVSGVPMAYLVAAGLTALGAPRGGWGRWGLAAIPFAAGIALVACELTGAAMWAAVGLATPALLALPWRARVRTRMTWLGVGVVALQGLYFAAPLVETRPAAVVLPPIPITESLSQPIGTGRVLAIDSPRWGTLFGANDLTRYGLESLRGYNPLLPNSTRELLLEAGGARGARVREGATSIGIRDIQHLAPLNLLNTQWIISSRPIRLEGLTLQRSYGAEHPFGLPAREGVPRDARRFVYENERRMPRAGLVRRAQVVSDAAAALAAIRHLDPREHVFVEDAQIVGEFEGSFRAVPVSREGDRLTLDVDAGQGGFLVISELAHPGWRAWIDGREVSVHRANGHFLLLPLAAGQQHVELAFRPRSLQLGTVVTWICLAGMVGLLLWGRSR